MQPEPTGVAKRIRVFIAESNLMAGQLIGAKLNRCREGFSVQGHVGNSAEILEQVKKSEPHLAVASEDLQYGPVGSFDLLKELRRSRLKCTAIVLLN